MWNYNEIILTVYKSGYRRLVEMARAKSPAALEFVTCPEDGSVYYLRASCWDNSRDGVAVIEEFMKTDTPYCFIRLGKEDFDIEVRSQFDDAGELVHTVTMEQREVGFCGHEILDGEAILRDEGAQKEEK